MIKIDTKYCGDFFSDEELKEISKEVVAANDKILNRTGEGNEFLGWADLPCKVSEIELQEINEAANFLKERSELIIVIGIGGSYLGSRAVIEGLSKNYYQYSNSSPQVLFAGNNLDEDYLNDLLHLIQDKEISLIVISKSGTTTEPAVAFRILKDFLENKYGEKASERIIAITDSQKGALKDLAGKNKYKTFIIPDDVGGRFSVLTPVGLLPVACAGFDISKILEGAKDVKSIIETENNLENNPAFFYSALRNIFYRKNKKIEILTCYKANMNYFIEWWKQLYGESEGKGGKGIFPAGTIFTTDLHSMGQLIQDGERNIFETVLSVEKVNSDLKVPFDDKNTDNLNYIAEKKIHEINLTAEEGTSMAHTEGGVPGIKISIPEISENTLGQMIFFFEYACALSGYVLGVNPFDQPGVEAYKKNMFKLLGKG